jgi:hypothetical protein
MSGIVMLDAKCPGDISLRAFLLHRPGSKDHFLTAVIRTRVR